MNLYEVGIGVPPIVLKYFCVAEGFGAAADGVLEKAQADGFDRLQETDVTSIKLVCIQSQLVVLGGQLVGEHTIVDASHLRG